jgi:hypothetical protein
MNRITQLSIFENNQLGDLEKLNDVLNALPDEKLIALLEEERGKGRNDYPVFTMWRAFLASFVFQHPTVAALIRELKRNSQLREVCGFQTRIIRTKKGSYRYQLAPTEAAFSRFVKKLLQHQGLLDVMFHELVDEMYVSLDGFGEILALDGKIIPSYAKGPNQNKQEDGRRDTEANFTIKQYTTTTPSGEKVTNKKKWFGYRLHLIIDATYELPIGYELTKASEGEPTVAKRLIKALIPVDKSVHNGFTNCINWIRRIFNSLPIWAKRNVHFIVQMNVPNNIINLFGDRTFKFFLIFKG